MSGPYTLQTSIVTFYLTVNQTKLIGKTTGHTSFWAEKIEFIMGIYDVDKSGETERIRIRGSGSMAGSSAGFVDVDGCVIRLISSSVYSEGEVYLHVRGSLQQRAFVMAPTNAQGASMELRFALSYRHV